MIYDRQHRTHASTGCRAFIHSGPTLAILLVREVLRGAAVESGQLGTSVRVLDIGSVPGRGRRRSRGANLRTLGPAAED